MRHPSLQDTRRFLAVDDHQIFLAGFRQVVMSLFPQSDCVCASTPRQALDMLDRHERFDLILVDHKMPDLDGPTLITGIRSRRITSPIAVLSGETSHAMDRAARQAGANGCLSKRLNVSELKTEISRLLAGETLEFVEADENSPLAKPKPSTLSRRDLIESYGICARQFDILELVAKGLSNKEIGQTLNIAEPTVKTHLVSLFRHLGARNRTACVIAARNVGLID